MEPEQPESPEQERVRKLMETANKIGLHQIYEVERQMADRKGCIGNLIFFGGMALLFLLAGTCSHSRRRAVTPETTQKF